MMALGQPKGGGKRWGGVTARSDIGSRGKVVAEYLQI
jgi:hypothetical protein